jgi:hypothetical protein
MRRISLTILVLCLVASAAVAGPARNELLEAGVLQTFSGRIDVVNQGQGMEMKLATDSGDRWFRVETRSLTPLPRSFSAGSAEVYYWQGHLLVMVPQEKRALFFSLRDFRPARPAPWIKENLGPVRDAGALDALLSGYEVTRVSSAVMIASSQGPRALEAISIGGSGEDHNFRDKVFYQDPGGGGGSANCSTNCSTHCGDGSSCSVTCVSPRCASCDCPASCSCVFR